MKSIIIVTYNSAEYIETCLESIVEHLSEKDEVFVIDNNSKDNTLDKVKPFLARNIQLYHNEENLGFARAINQGIKMSRGKYIFLVNPDTSFTEDVFSPMIFFASNHKKAGIIGIRQLDENNISLGSFGHFPRPLSNIIQRLKLHHVTPWGHWVAYHSFNKSIFTSTSQVDWVGGGFMMIKREVIDEIGTFDEDFFMYWEDVDYCLRASKAGFEVWYLGKIFVHHFAGASSGKNKSRVNFLSQQSFKYFKQKYNIKI